MEQTSLFDHKGSQCTFCKIIRGEMPGHLVIEDTFCMAFLDHRPLVKGHCLLVPRDHFETLNDLPSILIPSLFGTMQRLARAVEKGLKADGYFVAINNRISQSVPHLHIHIVPRWKKDGLFSRGLIWRRLSYEDEESVLTIIQAIRGAWEEPGS